MYPYSLYTLSTSWKIISAPKSILGRTLPFLRRASARTHGPSVGHLSCTTWARLSERHSTAGAWPPLLPRTTQAPMRFEPAILVSSQPAFDERGGTASEAVTN